MTGLTVHLILIHTHTDVVQWPQVHWQSNTDVPLKYLLSNSLVCVALLYGARGKLPSLSPMASHSLHLCHVSFCYYYYYYFVCLAPWSCHAISVWPESLVIMIMKALHVGHQALINKLLAASSSTCSFLCCSYKKYGRDGCLGGGMFCTALQWDHSGQSRITGRDETLNLVVYVSLLDLFIIPDSFSRRLN